MSQRTEIRGQRAGVLAGFSLIVALLCSAFAVASVAAAAGSEARKAELRADMLAAPWQPNSNRWFKVPIMASADQDIPREQLDESLNAVLADDTGSFRLAEVVRALYLTNRYDAQILPVLEKIRGRFWASPGEGTYLYSTENHQALWLSSAYLMRQRQGWAMDPQLDRLLNHFLDLKLQRGFYEFLSKRYMPYLLGPLLNLADFAADPAIKAKATAVARKLMLQAMLVFNDKGYFYSAGGRNRTGDFVQDRPRALYWLATGRGAKPTPASLASGQDYGTWFLVSSGVPLDDIGDAWQPTINTTLTQGHSPKINREVHAGLTRRDRTLFQLSAGSYLLNGSTEDTVWYFVHGLAPIPLIPEILGLAATLAHPVIENFSRGFVISESTVDIYRNGGVALTGIEDFHSGHLGQQQYPWSATVDDVSVFTQSATLKAPTAEKPWEESSTQLQNSHLPKVRQRGNVALITYAPNFGAGLVSKLPGLGQTKDVSLYWPASMTETIRIGKWVVGRKNDSYVAVYINDAKPRNGGGFVSSLDGGRQTWAAVVGNQATHGSFANFQQKIRAAKVTSELKPTFPFLWLKPIYATSVDVDGTKISQSWRLSELSE